ncbi:MAG: sulfinoalanine decarboxylase [bacterium]|jgi:sulfinoalanine decarboxylase
MSEQKNAILADLDLFKKLVDFLLNEETQNQVAKRIDIDELDGVVDVSIQDEPILDSELLSKLEDLIEATPKTATKLFFNQLFGGRQGKAMLGDLLAVLLNNSMYTYKVAGPQVAIEKEIITKSCDFIGYGEDSDGTIPTGGSMSNYMALIMARDRAEPEIRTKGMRRSLVMYTSKESHYSNAKNASFSGIGRNQVRYIATNERGQMITSELRLAVQSDVEAGNRPFYVTATAGTTVLGAFDPVNEIADICEEFNLWLHVDGAYCGAVIFSETYRKLIKGMERSDSFSYNAHKMLGTPLTCSLLLVREKQYLAHSFGNEAEYLYQTDDDDYNLGKTSFQCGRRNDALKFWTLWKSIGSSGLQQIVDKQFELAVVAFNYVSNNPDYEVYSFEPSISVCFNYKGIDAKLLCTALYEESETVVGYGSFRNETFVRFITINPNNSEEDILNFFNIIEEFVANTPQVLSQANTIRV